MASPQLAGLSSPTHHPYAFSPPPSHEKWASRTSLLSPSPVIKAGPTSTPRSPPSRPPPSPPTSSPPRRAAGRSASTTPSSPPYGQQSLIFDGYARSSPRASSGSPDSHHTGDQDRKRRSILTKPRTSRPSVPSPPNFEKALPAVAEIPLPKLTRAGMPTYVEGEEWIIHSVRPIGYEKKEDDGKWVFLIGVTRESVRSDGQWAKEVEYRIARRWDAIVALREGVATEHPKIEHCLPRLSKGGLFTRSSRSTQATHYEELEVFLTSLFQLSHKVTDSGPVREAFSRDVPLVGPVSYVADLVSSIKRGQDLDRVRHAGLPLQMLGSGVDDAGRIMKRKGSAPLLNQFGRGMSNDGNDADTIRAGQLRRPPGLAQQVLGSQSMNGRPRPQRSITISDYPGQSDMKTPTSNGAFSPADLDRSFSVKKSPSKDGLSRSRPLLRAARSMSDVRGATGPPPHPPPTSAPPPVPSIPSQHESPKRIRQPVPLPHSRESSQRSSLEKSRQGSYYDGSPRLHRRGGGNTSSSGSSNGSGSFSGLGEGSALGLSMSSNRSTSTESLIYSETSLASPKVPATPPSIPLSLDGADGNGKYYLDESTGRYLLSTTPSVSLYSIPPVSTPVPTSPSSDVTAIAPSMEHSRSGESTPSKRHGYLGHSMSRSRSGSGPSQAPRLSTIIASPNVDVGAFASEADIVRPLEIPPVCEIGPTITVKVMHPQTNIQVKVPRDTSLPRLCVKIAHKYCEGAGISLSADGEYDWKLKIVGRPQDGEPVAPPFILDEVGWKSVQEGAARIVVRVV